MYIYVCVCVCVCMYICVYVGTYIYICRYTHIHTHIYTHTHIHTFTLSYSDTMYRLGSDDILIGIYTEEYNLDFEMKWSCIHLKQEENTRRHFPENKPMKSPKSSNNIGKGFLQHFLSIILLGITSWQGKFTAALQVSTVMNTWRTITWTTWHILPFLWLAINYQEDKVKHKSHTD